MSVLLPQHCRNSVGLGFFPFARHYSGNHYCFIFLPVLRCFSSQGSLPICIGFPTFSWKGYPIRISPDHRLFAPPRSFSQLVTSFFASKSLGIPHTPLLTFLKVFFKPFYSVVLCLFQSKYLFHHVKELFGCVFGCGCSVRVFFLSHSPLPSLTNSQSAEIKGFEPSPRVSFSPG